MVLFCPNIGLLSTAVLSLIPLIRPFSWQSLLMPVLPALDQMLDLMDAPVPFILGVQVCLQGLSIPFLQLDKRFCIRRTSPWESLVGKENNRLPMTLRA